MKRIFIAAIIVSMTWAVFAQEDPTINDSDPNRIGVVTAQQNLKEVSVEKFEYDGFWRADMSPDDGFVVARLFEGGPNREANPRIPEEESLNIPDRYVLGARVDFLRRGHMSFTLSPVRPIPIEGITKTVSVWVVGRNYNHSLYLQLTDFFGRPFELYMGKLNFQGWQKLTVAIPTQGEDGRFGIVQRNYHYYNTKQGIKITGFRVECDPMETYGTYYVYFDDLRAVTDLFAEEDANKDPDDPHDYW